MWELQRRAYTSRWRNLLFELISGHQVVQQSMWLQFKLLLYFSFFVSDIYAPKHWTNYLYSNEKDCMYFYNKLLYSGNQHNIVNQLYLNKIKEKHQTQITCTLKKMNQNWLFLLLYPEH